MIIALLGKAGSGKSTIADYLQLKHRFVIVSLADELKRTLMRWYDFTEVQLWGPSEERNKPDPRYTLPNLRRLSLGEPMHLTPRHAAQFLGTEIGRALYENTWVGITLRTARDLLTREGHTYSPTKGLRFDGTIGTTAKGVVVPDCRFINEVGAFKKAGAKLVRVTRPGAGLTGAAGQHPSETEQDQIPDSDFDFILENDLSVEMLKARVDQMMDVFNGRIIPFDEEQADVPPGLRK